MRTYTLAELYKELGIGNPSAYLRKARVLTILSETQLFFNTTLIECRLENGFLVFYGLTHSGNFERVKAYNEVLYQLTIDQATYMRLIREYGHKETSEKDGVVIVSGVSDLSIDTIIRDEKGNRLFTEAQISRWVAGSASIALALLTTFCMARASQSKKK